MSRTPSLFDGAAIDDARGATPEGGAARIFTVGHSTGPVVQFVDLLKAHGVEALADVRRYPRSRRNPQFNDTALAAALAEAGIEYAHFPGLGGRRRAVAGSPNDGWDSEGFRGYADYMLSDAFAAALHELESRARRRPTAIMCAEAVHWRCHRRLIADALHVRGWRVLHLGAASRQPLEHTLTAFARVGGERIIYPRLTAGTGPIQ